MAEVFVGIGSNIERCRHIASGLDALDAEFAPLRISPVYRSEAIGFAGEDFFNLVVGFDTALAVGELADVLRRIEDAHGRRRDAPRFSSRTLDLDILTYDDRTGVIDGVRLPREEVLQNAFVLRPLADLAGERRHPVTGKTYAQHWEEYDKTAQRLWRIDFEWRGRNLSRVD